MPRRDYAGGAISTTITASLTASSISITIASATGWPAGTNGKFFAVINRAGANEEKILVLSRTGTTLTLESVSDRGLDGTTAATHNAGETIEHCFTATDADEANQHINDTASDSHTQYLNNARHDTTARHTMGSVVPTGVPGAISPDDTASEGVANSAARSDHRHAITAAAAGASAVADTASEGVATTFARSDHRHSREAFAAPVAVGTAIAAGVATTVPRSDHVHTVGTGALNALAQFASPTLPIFVCTAATRPSHVEGQPIYETDTERIYVSDGAAWRYIAGGDPLYAFRAYRNAAGSATGPTTIVFDAEVYDNNSNYDIATGIYTVPITGIYDIAACVSLQLNNNPQRWIIVVFVGAVERMRGNDFTVRGGNTADVWALQVAGQLKLTASDAVTIKLHNVEANATVVNTGEAVTWFTMAKRP